MHVVFRVDGGSQIGYGHLIRSSALAAELQNRKHTITVATTTPEQAQEVFPGRTTTVDLPSRAEPEPFLSYLDTESTDAVFTDAYPIDTIYQQMIRDRVPLAVLQDDARHAVCADLFTNGNLYAPGLDYQFVGKPPTTCLGTDYVLLRNEIRNRAAEDPPWRQVPERALITMGGSDMRNLTPTIIEAFDGFDLRVDAIVGPGFSEQQQQEIHEVAEMVSADVQVARDPDNLPERMFQADFAVSTASSTTYELLSLGTPLISIPVIDNQKPIAEALRERDLATVIEDATQNKNINHSIEKYTTDLSVRQDRLERGRGLVDGKGAERVGDMIEKMIV
jgi:UDP-2,4-diacetamido-2,4,6-trideoxy-beta-L-altropyranose hydrolase